MSVLEKFKVSSFVEHLWGNLLLAIIVISFIFLIVILFYSPSY
jgi:hypothetical protein